MNKYRILVADDEPIERQVIQKKIMGFFPEDVEIVTAENGLQAVEQYSQKDCRIALLDIEMPGMNGLEAAASIRKNYRNACIIFLTAFDEFSYAKKAIEVRALDYLLKPGNDGDLVNVLEEAFRLTDMAEKLPYLDSTVTNAMIGEVPGTLKYAEPGTGRTDAAFVQQVKEYIEGHYRDDIALQDIADIFGYSDVYFCKLFKQSFGMNFISYLNNYRIEKAKNLLANPIINIKDVSVKAGFRDANYFTRIFKRMEGATPSEYRSKVCGI